MPRTPKPWTRGKRPGWYATIGGKQIRLVESGTFEEAQRVLYRLLSQSRPQARSDLTVAAALDLWMDHVKATCKPSTYATHAGIAGVLSRALGTVRLADLTPGVVERWLASRDNANVTKGQRRPISQATKRTLIVRLRSAIRWCRAEGHYPGDDPLVRLKAPAMTRRANVMTEAERAAIVDAAPPDLKAFLEVLSATGARPHLLWELESRHVDWVGGTATLESKRKPYTLYFSEPVLLTLRRLASEHPDGPLFRTQRGRPWGKANLRAGLRRVCSGLGMRTVTAYEFRHETATRLLQIHPPAVVAAYLNHASLNMLSAHYSRVSERPALLRSVAESAELGAPKKRDEPKRGKAVPQSPAAPRTPKRRPRES